MLQCSRRSAEQRLSQITHTLSAALRALSNPPPKSKFFNPNFDYLRNIRDSDTRKGGNNGTKQNTTVTEALVRIQHLLSTAQTRRVVPKVRIPFCLFYEYDSRYHNFVLFYTFDSLCGGASFGTEFRLPTPYTVRKAIYRGRDL